jgi:hypothetical protein
MSEMSEKYKDRKDREAIHAILKESLQIKGSMPEPRKAFDETWITQLREYKSAKGIAFTEATVCEYLKEHGCSTHIIEKFVRPVFTFK